MFLSLFQTTYKKINFEDLQTALLLPNRFIIINTLPIIEQKCLIKNTLSYELEEKTINDLLNNYELNLIKIIIYGKNSNDISVDNKYKQLIGLGFKEVYIYSGGLFEWLLLQDIYGFDEFPTTIKIMDILKYKAHKIINN